MPLVTAPNLIEQSDFSDGWNPDLEASAVPSEGLLGVMNLLPDIGSGTPEVRRGFKRLVAGVLIQGYTIQAIYPYNRLNAAGTEEHRLVVVATTEDDATSGNVAVWAYDLDNDTATLVSPNTAGTPDKTFVKGDARHGGVIINGIFFGFPPDDNTYSWDPVGGWQDDVAVPSYPTHNATSTFNSTNRPHDFAYKKGNEVLFTDPVFGERAYETTQNNRFKTWKSGRGYKRGTKVSIKKTWGGVDTTYWRSFEAKRTHDADANNEPGAGSGLWRKVVLEDPANDEGEVSEDWDLVPSAPKTNVAMWHGERLWMRYDDIGDSGMTRMLFSPPSKPKKKSDVGELEWDPKDWRIGDLKGKDRAGDGGGWENFGSGDGDPLMAVVSHGYYGLFFKRRSTYAIAGLNRRTWHKRKLADYGAVGPKAATTHEGVVFFVSDDGLFMTEGTQVKEVPGGFKVREWLRESLNWESARKDVQMWSFQGFVWVAVPTMEGQALNRVLIYEPHTESFWLLDLEVSAAAVNELGGVDQMFFAKPTQTGEFVDVAHAWLGDEHRSQSTRTLPGPVVETNLFLNPSFEPKPKIGNPTVVEDFETITEAQTSAGWSETGTTDVVDKKKTARHKRRGLLGKRVKNNGANFQGIYQTFADEDATTHTISGYFKKSNWKKFRKISYKHVRIGVDLSGATLVDLPEVDHTYTHVGRGWWRVSATYTGSVSQRAHGFSIKPGLVVFSDALLCMKGATLRPYFDGDGSDSTGLHAIEGGDQAIVYQYDHPDVQENPMDDLGGDTYTPRPIGWGARVAWFPFGALREDRRIRRVWALVRGAVNILLRGYRNFRDDSEFEVETLPSSDDPATHHEGRVLPDGFAANLSVEGLGSPAALLGVAIDTQPRRVRYHT